MPLREQVRALTLRRLRICKHAPLCPKCRARQVQLTDSGVLAEWKCRECKHRFVFEPIIRHAEPMP